MAPVMDAHRRHTALSGKFCLAYSTFHFALRARTRLGHLCPPVPKNSADRSAIVRRRRVRALYSFGRNALGCFNPRSASPTMLGFDGRRPKGQRVCWQSCRQAGFRSCCVITCNCASTRAGGCRERCFGGSDARRNDIQQEVWRPIAANPADPRPPTVASFVQALNDIIDVQEKRLAASRGRVRRSSRCSAGSSSS
jgi:hypothetical protein